MHEPDRRVRDRIVDFEIRRLEQRLRHERRATRDAPPSLRPKPGDPGLAR